MKRLLISGLIVVGTVLLVGHGGAVAGVQVTTCTERVATGPPPEDQAGMVMKFFACPPNVTADELVIELVDTSTLSLAECSAPASLVGSSCSHPNGTSVSFTFPEVGPFECVPSLAGDLNKFTVMLVGDGASTAQPIAREIWKRRGVVVANFVTILACPDGPISVDAQSWGRVKAMYR